MYYTMERSLITGFIHAIARNRRSMLYGPAIVLQPTSAARSMRFYYLKHLFVIY